MDRSAASLAPAAVASLKAHHGAMMERSLSQDIREEREELREAAEQTLNAIVDLNLDGTIRWVSPSWTDVVGTPFEAVNGIPITDLIVSDNKTVFSDVVDSMKRDDSRSYRVSFVIQLGPLSKLQPIDALGSTEPQTSQLEAQGIMVYDSVSGGESHTMWMLRPWSGPHEIKIDLPQVMVDSLGSGAEILASYLTHLADSAGDESLSNEAPRSVLCRICERQIQPWWFEKHTDLCLQEHRAEMDVQMAQESLTEHRHAIVRVLDDLEARKSRSMAGEQPAGPMAEYKGISIGPAPSTQSSPGSSLARSRDRTVGMGHARARSFAVRRPQARIVELLMDLCDTAIEISSPAIKESSMQQENGEIRTQSPQSESRMCQVMQWQSPSTNTLDQEQGLALLCADTERVARAKVDAVIRHGRILEYAERIRIELAVLVEACVDSALRKAARVAAGRLSDSSDGGSGGEEEARQAEMERAVEEAQDGQQREHDDETMEGGPRAREGEERRGRSAEGQPRQVPGQTADGSSVLATALRQMEASASCSPSRSRPASFVASRRSSSSRECATPRSHVDGGLMATLQSRDLQRRASSLSHEAEVAESEGSMRSSSVVSRQTWRMESPMADAGDLRRAASARQHHRQSLVIPGSTSPHRQESPSRGAQPSSPLRIKPRILPVSHEGVVSPEASPMFANSEFSSPISHPVRHHRRQSSAAISDLAMRAPPSPRLSASQAAPQPRPLQPSIKDFEIIKPISKGAFGSVYLSKKKSTGEYFAIKVLKKADMVAKNQVGNVKAERAIMMWQGQSDFVAKLYWTFSSKDYLYLVMEYLNGGDCASLIKVLGGLPEDWVKKYLGEVVLGVEHLHERDIIHRDLKPDNLLIDQKGHLKLTDFGLSRMGLVGRQKRALNSETAETTPDLLKQGPFARSTSMASSRSTSLDLQGQSSSPGTTPQVTPDSGQPAQFSLASLQQEPRRISSSHCSDSGGSEALANMLALLSVNESDAANQSSVKAALEEDATVRRSPDSALRASVDGHARSSLPQTSMMAPRMALFDPQDTTRRFVGTPDYLAPETIKGDKQDESSDWWSVGCILFEFLYGVPPFHADEAEQVFDNILARNIQWPAESPCEAVSDEAKDVINKLLCMDPKQRLGANRHDKFASGGEEIRRHAWFDGINWDTLLQDEAQFVPHVENPEDTEYFDARGAVLQSFAEEMEDQMSPQSSTAGSDYPDRPHDALSRVRSQVNSMSRKLMPLHIPPHVRDLKSRRLSEPVANDDFGAFTFKNLPVLEKANKDVIQKLRADALAAQSKLSAASPGAAPSPAPSLDASPVFAGHVHRTISSAKAGNRPQSPSGLSLSNSSPSRASQPSSPLMVSFVAGQGAEARRKASSNSSSLSHLSTPLQPPLMDVPKVPPSLQKAATSVAAMSPIKGRGPTPAPLPLSPQKMVATPRHASTSSTSRSRSLTVGSQDASPIASDVMHSHRNRRSQVFDMSPSSSDNEGDKHNALLRVQRRRQSSRRLSHIAFDGGPTFRPLDVLICEDHPVSRMVMEKLLEKLRCRTISVANGSEAVRYSLSEIQFDVIFLEFKLPQINGADVARMIRETKNANSHTPIVAITAYLKELQAPHYFDSLVEKPISSSKLSEVLASLCQWRPDSPQRAVSGPLPHPLAATGLRKTPSRAADDNPPSSLSALPTRFGSALVPIRHDPIASNPMASSLFGDAESATANHTTPSTTRITMRGWRDEAGSGSAATEAAEELAFPTRAARGVPSLISQQSAPGQMEHMARLYTRREAMGKRAAECTESADDEDDEADAALQDNHVHRSSKAMVGRPAFPSSKLAIEMMRADSHDSVIMSSDSTSGVATQVATTPSLAMDMPLLWALPTDGASHMPPEHQMEAHGSQEGGRGEENEDGGGHGGSGSQDQARLMDTTPRPTALSRLQETPEVGDDEATPKPAGN